MTTPLRLPDFIIAGAPRCGTTWLYHVLAKHPQLYLAQPVVPEPKFFLVDQQYARGLEYYSATWFTQARPECVAGEKSTNYLESPLACKRMARDLPHARLMFLLRNPIERAYSNYLWSRKNGHESADFLTALQTEEIRERHISSALRYARPHAYISRGLYADLLRPYLQAFGGDHILCLRFEDILSRPAELATQTHRFLGVAERPDDAYAQNAVNESEPAAPPMPAAARTLLTERYREPNCALAELLGKSFWPESLAPVKHRFSSNSTSPHS